MPRYGFSGEKPDMKKLILFAMKSLPDRVTENELSSIALLDDNANYFVFSDALCELIASGQVLREHDGRFSLSPGGHNLAHIVESDIAAALRRVAEEAAQNLTEQKKRDDCIRCGIKRVDDELYFEGELTDGVSPLYTLRLLIGSEEQGKLLTKRFQAKAEVMYETTLDQLIE